MFDLKAWLWFVTSYAPLWVMLGLRFDPIELKSGLIALGGVSFAYVAWLVRRNARERPSNTTLTITGDAGSDVSGYLAAYLLPFLTVSEPDPSDLAAYGIFIAVAGLVYVRSDLAQINPTVYLANRRVFRATVPVGQKTKEVFVISGRDLRVSSTLKGERFSDRVFIDHSKDTS